MRRAAAFTLLEVLAVVLLTSMVIGLSLDFYVEMTQRTTRAAAFTRDIRRATAVLDRVARDFEHAVLLRKRPEQDPLTHPWLFLAEAGSSALGAERIKFVSFGQVARSSRGRESDLALVAYLTREDPDGNGLELFRWSSPQLPESLDRDFPHPEDEASQLLADGLADFGVLFLGEDGEWSDRWDSSLMVESGELPLAVEIRVAVAGPEDAPAEESVVRSRKVLLPMRPIDPAELRAAEEEAPQDQPLDEEPPNDGTAPGLQEDPQSR